METFHAQLERFLDGPPVEVLETVVGTLQRDLMPEMKTAVRDHSGYLVVLGTHAVIQLVAEKVFGMSGLAGTQFFLQKFVDDSTWPDRVFSTIHAEMHDLRNVVGHLWLSAEPHNRIFDWYMPEGWKWQDDGLHINLRRYFEQFEQGLDQRFSRTIMSLPEELQLRRKYVVLRQWLNLTSNDPIAQQIHRMSSTTPIEGLRSAEKQIVAELKGRYGLSQSEGSS